MSTAYVTEKDGREFPHICLEDGILNPANGSLVLIYQRNDAGHIKEGHIYAPGEWKAVVIAEDEE